MDKNTIIKSLLVALSLGFASTLLGRNVFLNGVDVTSARHQNLENVTIRIDGQGNIFIIAPHYQVNEESTYIPLSSWKHKPSAPENRKPGPLSMNPQKLPSHPAAQKKAIESEGALEKEGTKSLPAEPTETKKE